MSMSLQGQEIFISTITKVVVDVAIQDDDEYNKFMDAVISSLIAVARIEKLWDEDEINVAIAIINQRAKEMIDLIDFSNDERHKDIDDIIKRAFNNK